MPLFPRWTNTVSRLSVFLLLALPAVAIAGLLILVRSPYGTKVNRQVVQPIQFDHRHHVKDDLIDCRYCHTSVDSAPSAGIPPTELCLNCHSQVWNGVAEGALPASSCHSALDSSAQSDPDRTRVRSTLALCLHP